MGQLLFADEIHTVEQAKIDAARISQKANNERQGAETTLANFSASLSNSRAMEAAGSAVNDIRSNVARVNAKALDRSVNNRLAVAEELGAVAAMAAAAGVGGSSVETYNETVRLRAAMAEQEIESAMKSQGVAAGTQAGNQIRAAVATRDNNMYRANIDYTQYVDHKKPGLLERAIGLAGTIAATVFAGPQAGQAVMGLFEARAAAGNADFGSASQAIMGAAQNGIGAARTHNRTRTTGDGEDYSVGYDKSVNDVHSFFNNRPTFGSVTLN